MGHVPLLDELAIIAALAVVVTILLAKLKLPTVAGLLAAGALLGPFGLGLVRSIHSIEVLAEIGVVLLLFSIGLEFSLDRLKHIFRTVALGGFLQVSLTTAATAAVAMALGETLRHGIFFGFVVALSSTAIVLRALAERQELDAPHGRFIVGTLIFQDLCVVPMVLIVPLLGAGGTMGSAALGVGLAMGKAAVVVIGIIALARTIIPRLLTWVDASRSREIFLLAILALCIGTAWLTSMVGLSLALGAFLGGMVVAGTEFRHRAMGDLLPLRDAFVSIFFVSLGMLFNPRIVFQYPLLVAALLAAFLFAKGMLATFSALIMRFPARVAWLAGVGLAQFGEFGFVLCRLGESSGVLTHSQSQPILAAGIISMFLTPLLVRSAPRFVAGERLLAPLERLLGVRSIDEADEGNAHLKGHLVIVGFGVGGRFAARVLSSCGIPLVVLDLNAENVRQGKQMGLPVYYGDATSEEALTHAHLGDARLLVLLINDPAAAKRIVDTARRVAPGVAVLMRVHYLQEREDVFKAGANDVVAEEVEGAVEVIARMLRWLEIPRNIIESEIAAMRAQTQTSERRQTIPRSRLGDIRGLEEMKIESAVVREGSRAVGASLSQLRLRSETGALVVGIRRDTELLEKPDPEMAFQVGDIVYFVGTGEAIERALHYVEPGA